MRATSRLLLRKLLEGKLGNTRREAIELFDDLRAVAPQSLQTMIEKITEDLQALQNARRVASLRAKTADINNGDAAQAEIAPSAPDDTLNALDARLRAVRVPRDEMLGAIADRLLAKTGVKGLAPRRRESLKSWYARAHQAVKDDALVLAACEAEIAQFLLETAKR